MKNLKWIAIAAVSIYVLFFFLWAPVYLASISAEWYALSRLASGYDSFANQPVASLLGNNNFIYKAHNKNTQFWCNRFEDCKFK